VGGIDLRQNQNQIFEEGLTQLILKGGTVEQVVQVDEDLRTD